MEYEASEREREREREKERKRRKKNIDDLHDSRLDRSFGNSYPIKFSFELCLSSHPFEIFKSSCFLFD
jgi:hypothetical protein